MLTVLERSTTPREDRRERRRPSPPGAGAEVVGLMLVVFALAIAAL
jgi:hypothetical protein